MNAPPRTRPLGVGPLRTFETVARLLNFRAAAEALHLSQPAVSRQIQALEQELGLPLFLRGTRHVALTPAGAQLRAVIEPQLARLDACVSQLRQDGAREVIHLSTFASLASLWLLPRLEAYQRAEPEIDLRVNASDALHDLDRQGFDLALSLTVQRPPEGQLLFPDVVNAVHSPARAARIASGELRPLRTPADLREHTLADEDDIRPSSQVGQWRHWLAAQGLPTLQPRRWLLLSFSYQQVQAALAGQALALARLPLVEPWLTRGELIETFGRERRLATSAGYWLRVREPQAPHRPALKRLLDWLHSEAAATRASLDAAA